MSILGGWYIAITIISFAFGFGLLIGCVSGSLWLIPLALLCFAISYFAASKADEHGDGL